MIHPETPFGTLDAIDVTQGLSVSPDLSPNSSLRRFPKRLLSADQGGELGVGDASLWQRPGIDRHPKEAPPSFESADADPPVFSGRSGYNCTVIEVIAEEADA
ncbi:hypothetical protein AB0K40_35565 [Nonomuraea bangladeshensis]|uniref:Uncharacterized protein n=1 Tax=Nonomuraea bangladeshensis TaxID=404385 RepID=A0ABV3HE92_9ACTN